LAQYAFASWGTAVVIPQQEDHGLDLHCTLMEQIGGRLLAKCPYTVQVKSEMKAVVFEGKDAVRWVIEHPLPLFLCIVNKATTHITWSLGQWPDRLAMIPQPAIPGQQGRCAQWPDSYDLSLDQPILEFSIIEMLDESFWANERKVFEHWLEVENENLTRVRTRLPTCRVPGAYKTNDTWVGGWKTLSLNFPNEEQFNQTTAGLNESLAWVGEQLLRKGDLDGAARAALLHRHLFSEDDSWLFQSVQAELNSRFGKDGYVYAGVDHLAEVVDQALKGSDK
jgi:hypothetical protein